MINVRKIDKQLSYNQKIINTVIILIIGVFFGILSKLLDTMSFNNDIWWHRILLQLDLGNVLSSMGIWLFLGIVISIYSTTPLRASLNTFIFFLGMNVAYHISSILIAGFNPLSYMKIWYLATFLSIFISYICWYAKSDDIISTIVSSLIYAVLLLNLFSIGLWYFDIQNYTSTLIFILSVIVINKKAKNTCVSLLCGLAVAFIYDALNLAIFFH